MIHYRTSISYFLILLTNHWHTGNYLRNRMYTDMKSLIRLQPRILHGERSVWPLIAFIRTRCMIELALDRGIYKTRYFDR